MQLVIIFVVALFLAAYGNAMRKVTWRRRLAAERGQPTAGTTKAYDVTGLVVMNIGFALIAVWVVAIAVGNPIEWAQQVFG